MQHICPSGPRIFLEPLPAIHFKPLIVTLLLGSPEINQAEITGCLQELKQWAWTTLIPASSY